MTIVEQSPTRSMSQIVTETVAAFRTQVPDCVTAALVDMTTGMLLAVDTLDERRTDDMDLLAAATFDLLQGRNVQIIQDVFAAGDGPRAERAYFQEMVVNTDDLVHVFLRSARHQDLVAVVSCRRQANIGMLFAQARLVMRQMDAGFGA